MISAYITISQKQVILQANEKICCYDDKNLRIDTHNLNWTEWKKPLTKIYEFHHHHINIDHQYKPFNSSFVFSCKHILLHFSGRMYEYLIGYLSPISLTNSVGLPNQGFTSFIYTLHTMEHFNVSA